MRFRLDVASRTYPRNVRALLRASDAQEPTDNIVENRSRRAFHAAIWAQAARWGFGVRIRIPRRNEHGFLWPSVSSPVEVKR
jgi:hypothetical protein